MCIDGLMDGVGVEKNRRPKNGQNNIYNKYMVCEYVWNKQMGDE